jgi:hypothetical protein
MKRASQRSVTFECFQELYTSTEKIMSRKLKILNIQDEEAKSSLFYVE